MASAVAEPSQMARPPRIAWAPLPILLLAVISLWFRNIQAPHKSPELLIALNLVLTTLPGAGIAFLFARNFLMTGAPGVVLLGCGALLWSASGLSTLIARVASPEFRRQYHRHHSQSCRVGRVPLLSGWRRPSSAVAPVTWLSARSAVCRLCPGAGGCGFPGVHGSSRVDAAFLRARQRPQP